MNREEVPGSSFMLCLGPGPPSLLHLTRANAEKPYAGDTIGQINAKIQESLDLKLQLANLGIDNFLELRIAGIKPEVEDLFSLLPDLSFFENLPRPE
jgi:hypothetical protein